VTKAVLLDAGPWVAYLRRADMHHVWAREQFSAREEFVRSGVVTLDFDLQSNVIPVENLMRKYRDQPMDLADACLVRMAEIEPRSLVVTTDGDFKVYRRNGREVIPHVVPD
jgi:uncharacterized protein